MRVIKRKRKITRVKTIVFEFDRKGIKYGIGIYPKQFWFDCWLPKWHKGRGRYLTIGLWLFSFYRGY